MIARNPQANPRFAALLATAALALALLACAAPRAGAYSIVAHVNLSTTNNAAAHPGFSTVAILDPSNPATGHPVSVSSISTTLPQGMELNPEAVPSSSRCVDAQLEALACPSSSAIGSLAIDLSVEGAGSLSASGTVYDMAPSSTRLARWGVVMRTPYKCYSNGVCLLAQRFSLHADLSFDGNVTPRLKETFSGFPTALQNGNATYPFGITRWAFGRSARAGGATPGKYFVTNPFRCTSLQSDLAVTTSAGVYTAPASYTPSYCENVTNTYFSSITTDTAALNTGTSAVLNVSIPIAESLREAGRADSLGANFPLGSSFDTSGVTACDSMAVVNGQCTAASAIGKVSASSVQFPAGFSGTAYVTAVLGQLYIYTAKLKGPAGSYLLVSGTVTTAQSAGEASSRVRLTLDRVPDIAVAGLRIDLNAPRFKLSADPCTGRANGYVHPISTATTSVIHPTYNGATC
jgi:hypothetical protein